MAGIAHVRVDSTMGSVRSPSLFGCLIDLDVLYDEVVGVEPFGVGVGFCVSE